MQHRLQRIIVGFICGLLLLACGKANIAGLQGGPITAGTDLLASYAAGQFVRDGHAAAMYDRAAMTSVENQVMGQARIVGDARFLPWMNPPFAALVFEPLAQILFPTAALIWLAINIFLVGACLMLLRGMMPAEFSLSRVVLLWLAVSLSMPFWQAMYAQQNTFVSLLLICLVTRYWLNGRGFWAGVFAGFMLFKPQLAMVLATVLGISMGAEAVVGFGVVAIGLLALTALALPGTITAYLHQLPPTIHWLQMELPYNWGRQTTLQGFWRLAIQGHAAGPTVLAARVLAWVGAAATGVPLALAAWRTRGGDRADRRRLIAAAIVATPLIAPYYMDYDLLLLAVAAALTIAEKDFSLIAGGGSPGSFEERTEDRGFRPRLLRIPFAIKMAWLGVAIALYLNPFVAAEGRWNVAVIAIAAMSILLIRNVFSHLPRVTEADRLFLSAPASALSR